MARVLVLTLVFPPDGVSTAVIVGEIAADLKAAGHEVTVVTTVPHYNHDAEAESRQPMRRVLAWLLSRSEFHGVKVIHLAMPKKTASVALRLAAWCQFHVLSLIATLILVRKVDVILSHSPPLTIGVCAWLLSIFYSTKFVYNVQELYPDIAIKLGAVKNRHLIGLLLRLERFVYARASVVTVIADRMRERILDKGVPSAKVRVIPNFVDVGAMLPLNKVNNFSTKHDLARRFVVSYAGNMGPAQGLDVLIDAAVELSDEPLLTVLFIGSGGERARLERKARELGAANVVFLPQEPYAVVPEIYAASDLCFVSLAAEAGSDAVPSKVYRIMACARPVVASADHESDLALLVRRAGAGVVVPPDAPRALAQVIRDAIRNQPAFQALGRAGRQHVETHYSRTVVGAQYDALVNNIVLQSVN